MRYESPECPVRGGQSAFSGAALIQCRRPNITEHGKRHVAHFALVALDRLHADGERGGELSGMDCFILLKTTDEHLKRRDHGGSVSCDDFAFGRELWLWHDSLGEHVGGVWCGS